jgi:protoheme IX farnesyltransferase
MIKTYYELTKPGIIYGNALVALAGFFFASKGHLDLVLLVATLVGLSLVIASGCVVNNVFDRDIDAKMERTKKRAMAAGTVSQHAAILFASALGAVGIELLWRFTTPTALLVALAGLVTYVCLYTPLKPRTPFALFVGAVAGAVPPVVGYTAVTNQLDWYAGALFLALYVWQIPHFLAIATYRHAEYAAAGVPLFINHEPSTKAKQWGRKVFRYSLVVLLVFCAGLMLHR